jgi:hypothetical protein
MKKFVSLGTECVEFLKAARASQGKPLFFFFYCVMPSACLADFLLILNLNFYFLCHAADALATANARIAYLGAELKASQNAWDVANAAKATTEKSAKAATTKAKKAEKALVDANQERIQREEAITKRLNQVLALAGGKFLSALFIVCLLILLMVTYFFFLFLLAEKIGVSSALLQPVDKDPLMAAVNFLELHWISVQEVLEVTRRVLMQFFVGLWPKKKADMPAADLKKLAAVLDTDKDPILSMKRRSVKRGVEGAIALAYSHGEEVDWEKVSSSHGRPLSELLGFFEKAKKYAPGIVSIINPSAASSTSTLVPSTPVTSGLMPPPNAGATSSAPTSVAGPDAEVA